MLSPSSEVLKEFEELAAAPLTHPSTLFLQEDGSPMHFYVPPGPWKRLLSALIEHGGGLLCRLRQPGALLLAPPEESFKAGPDTYISARFVAECVRAGELLDPEGYRLVPEDISTQPCCSHELVLSRSNSRSSFTRAEDLAILMYLRDHAPVGAAVTGTAVWKEMGRVQLTRHTWQAMKSRYFRKLRGRESDYQLRARTVIPTLVYPHCNLCRDTRGQNTTANGQEEQEDSVGGEASGERDIQEESTLGESHLDGPLARAGHAMHDGRTGTLRGSLAPPVSSTKVSSTEGARVLEAGNTPAQLEISEVTEKGVIGASSAALSSLNNDKCILGSDRGRQSATHSASDAGGSLKDWKEPNNKDTHQTSKSGNNVTSSKEFNATKSIYSKSLDSPELSHTNARKLHGIGNSKAPQCSLESHSFITRQSEFNVIDLSAEDEDGTRSTDLPEKGKEASATVATNTPHKKDLMMKSPPGELPQKQQSSGVKSSAHCLNTNSKEQTGAIGDKIPMERLLPEVHNSPITTPPLDENPREEREAGSSFKLPQQKMDHRDQNAANGIKRSRDEATHKEQNAVDEFKDMESSEEEEVQIKRRKKTSVNALENLGNSKYSVPVKCKAKQWPRIKYKNMESSDDEEFQIKRRTKAPPMKESLHIFEKANEEFESEDDTPDLANLTAEKTRLHQRTLEHPSPEQISGLKKYVLSECSSVSALEECSTAKEQQRKSTEHICEETQGLKQFVTNEDSRVGELEGDALEKGSKEDEQYRQSPELQVCKQPQGLKHFATRENSSVSELEEDPKRNTQCSGSPEPLPCWQPLRLNQFVCGEDSQINGNHIQANVVPCSSSASQIEIEKAIKSFQSLMNEFGLSLVTVTQAFLKNSGELEATKYFLKNSVRPDGCPIWSRQDDLDLKNGNHQLICNLNNKFGVGNVAKRIAFLRS
ncbi:hypothetical protein NDU88_006534 [Pleurodeles waltl]|uniref:Telomeric repeat-binding factor 2-interacting protein 1 n=1 Tax=Pleurodeles waltl TaxID=8319 RepID=A0AAV7MZH9_PLEWA|nr:hypothetical protein NDU88_006534 [Pleurodeles waltl]